MEDIQLEMNAIEGVEGLTALDSNEIRNPLANSKFALPPGFPAQHYASKWELEGNAVIEAQQPVILEGAGVKAQGWAVYMQVVAGQKAPPEEKEDGLPPDPKALPKFVPRRETVKRVVGKNTYVLMFRPKKLQEAVNKIHGNTSRRIVVSELRGETNAANPQGDRGILTNEQLMRAMRRTGGGDPDGETLPPEYMLPTQSVPDHPDRAGNLNLRP